MTTRTMYHVTDESNVDSISAEGLRSGIKNLVFLTTTPEEAEEIGDIYHTIEEPVVFEAEVMDHKLMEDPEPHGDLNSFAHRGDIPAHDVAEV